MKSTLLLLYCIAVLFIGIAPVSAHHGFAAEFDGERKVTIKGTLTSFEWVNPHSWIHADVKDADGKVVNWAVEFGTPNNLLRRGFRKTDFPAGVEIVVEGYPARNGTPTLNGISVKLPDGRNFLAGPSAPDAPKQ